MSVDPTLRRIADLIATEAGATFDLESALTTREPTFRDSDLELLAGLARGLLEPGFTPRALLWAERLMVFVEVRRNELRGRLRSKWPRPEDRLRGALALQTVLLACFRATGDLRMINTALKLGDAIVVTEARVLVTLRTRASTALAAHALLREYLDLLLADVRPEAW